MAISSNFSYFKFVVISKLLVNPQIKILLLPIILLMIFSNYTELEIPKYAKNIRTSFDSKNSEIFHDAIFQITKFTLIHYSLAWLYCFIFKKQMKVLKTLLIQQYVEDYLYMDYESFHELGTGKISSVIVRQTNSLCKLLEIFVLYFGYDSIFFIICIKRIYSFFGFEMLLTFLALTFVLISFIIFCTKILNFKRYKTNVYESSYQHKIFDILRNFSIIKAFNNENKEKILLKSEMKNYLKCSISYEGTSEVFSFVFRLLMYFPFTFVRMLCFYDAFGITFDGKLIDLLESYFILFKKRITRIREMSFDITERYTDITSFQVGDGQNITRETLIPLDFFKEIKFEKFSPTQRGSALFKELNFTVKKGEKIAITGRNGTGKSSILKTLLNFIKFEGNIYIDDMEISNINEKALHDLLAYVPQEPHILNTSVIENISYGINYNNEEEIIQSCIKLNTHKYFKDLSSGYYTNVGEGGKYLSGGQCQIINFTRAAIKDSPIILLDEPTSNLDYTTSEELLDTLFNDLKDKTVFVTTHNPSHLKRFDKILNIKNNQLQIYESLEDFIKATDGNLCL